jgi:signal peptidase I
MVRGEKFVVVIDSSMEPTIKEGATVSYVDFPFEQLKVGDIILYRAPGRDALIVARIVEVTQEGLRTKGDSNVAPHRIWSPLRITSERSSTSITHRSI